MHSASQLPCVHVRMGSSAVWPSGCCVRQSSRHGWSAQLVKQTARAMHSASARHPRSSLQQCCLRQAEQGSSPAFSTQYPPASDPGRVPASVAPPVPPKLPPLPDVPAVAVPPAPPVPALDVPPVPALDVPPWPDPPLPADDPPSVGLVLTVADPH